MTRSILTSALFFAILLLGCMQAPAPGPVAPVANGTVVTAASTGFSAQLAEAAHLFEKPGFLRYSVAITFPSNLTDEQQAISEFMQSLLQGQESTLAWDNSTFRLDTQIGLLGETLNQTTYLSANASAWCLDAECDAAAVTDTNERLDVARDALKSPYNFLKLPKNVDVEKAWIVTPSASSNQAGRKCDGFELALNQSYMNQTLYSVPAGELNDVRTVKQAVLLKGITEPMRVCLDQEKGFVALAKVEVDLSVAENDNEALRGLVMIMTQQVDEFRDAPTPEELQIPQTQEKMQPERAQSVSILPLGSTFTGSDGTQYGYVGKQNGSFVINISNVNDASCAPEALKLPEWTTFACNGTAHLFLIYEEESDEFQLAVTEHVFTIREYDAALGIIHLLPPDNPVPLSDLPLILMYEGTTAEGESILIGPWEGPCPTKRLMLGEKTGAYACDGQEYAIKADGKEEDDLRVQVLRK